MDKKTGCGPGKMMSLPLLYTPIIEVLKPLKILLSMVYLMLLYNTTGLPVILIAMLYHQICMAHLLRDLQYIIELYPDCQWATEMKALIKQALQLKKELSISQYYGECEQRQKLMNKLDELLQFTLNENYSKARTLQKNLLKHQQYILYFLYHPKVPPDNNGSERAIRNIKVKQKISGQFKSEEGANSFAVLRSVIDTTIKSGQNVLNALSLIAKLGTE